MRKFLLLESLEYHKTTNSWDVLVANKDALEFIKTIPDSTIDLIVSSPPYNVGKSYENKIKFEEYLEYQRKVIKEFGRILKKSGSLCWQVGNYVEKGEVFPLDFFFYEIIKKELGFKLRNRIIWHYGHGLHSKKRFSGRYETILWFTKSDEYKFNLDNVRIPQKYPGKRYYHGDKRGKPSCNPKGKNPSDFWEIIVEDFESCVWKIPNVKANHPEKTIHPCQFPIELVERLVLALTNEGDIVFDPFMGVGTTLIASLLHNRKAVGVDKERTYVEMAIQRIKQLESGTLKRRELGRPIYEPKGTEKVVLIPQEWKNDNNNEIYQSFVPGGK
ncbi:MAG: DNA-methyltransferase [Thermoplasmata archaeon]